MLLEKCHYCSSKAVKFYYDGRKKKFYVCRPCKEKHKTILRPNLLLYAWCGVGRHVIKPGPYLSDGNYILIGLTLFGYTQCNQCAIKNVKEHESKL